MEKWIPVSKQLPEINQTVLVTVIGDTWIGAGRLKLSDGVYLGRYNGEIWFVSPYNCHKRSTMYVVAWMPLPMLYEEKTNA